MIAVLRMAQVLVGARNGRDLSRRGLDDTQLIDLFLRNNDEEAFEILVRRYQDRIFRLAVSILGYGQEREAEDMTQEVFVVLFRTLSRFRGESAFATWFYRLARNRIIDRRRRLIRQATRAVADPQPATTPDSATDPLTATVASQQKARLMFQIDRLPELQRVTVRLYYWQDLRMDDIAELLEMSPNTVKSHLFRARRNLASVMAEEERGA